MNLDEIEWPELGPESHAMMAASVARQYNRIATKLGAKLVEVAPSAFDPKPSLSRYKLRTAADLAAQPLAAWLVRGVLPPAGIGAIYGASASGKTFLALHLLAHVAEGRADWFDHRIARPACVVYVGLEGEAGLSGRVRAWQMHYGPIPAGFRFLTGQPFELLSDQDVTDLASAVRIAAGPGAVICIDTLNAAAAGVDENASEAMSRIIAAAKRLQAETAGLVLLVHHSGKDAARGMRGHSSLFAACDVVIEVTRTDDRRTWKLVKSKDGADGVEHPFRLDVVEIGTDPEDGQAVTSCVIHPTTGAAAQTKSLTATQLIGMDTFMAAAFANRSEAERAVSAPIEKWREEFYRCCTAANLDSKRRAFNRVRAELVELGKLTVDGDVYRLPTGLQDFPWLLT